VPTKSEQQQSGLMLHRSRQLLVRSSEESRRLEQIPGVGPIVATALVSFGVDRKSVVRGQTGAFDPKPIDPGRSAIQSHPSADGHP
jgi:transposase